MVGEVAQSARGIQHQARSCLDNGGEVVAGVRRFAELLLIKSSRDVSVFCLKQRLILRFDGYGCGGRPDGQLDISGGNLTERDGEYLFRFLETGGRHREGINAWEQELEVVDAVPVGLGTLRGTF